MLSDGILRPLRWDTNQKKGIQLLQSISNDEDQLKIVLGSHYPTVLQALKVDRVNKKPVGTHLGAAQLNPQAHRGEPSAKKRKTSSTDIIDLT